MTQDIRWGILGTGDIARQFADDLRLVEGAELLAVGSRRQETADRFADTRGIPRRYGAYEALANDPDLDVVYIATPHTRHHDDALLCLEAGKAVLCEKPFTLNAAEAERLVQCARGRGLFLMEAMWTFFFPAFRVLRDLLEREALGAVHTVRADFSYRAAYDPASRLFDKALGGGALLDIGVYGVALAQLVFGHVPQRIESAVNWAPTGVDASSALLLSYESGGTALLGSSLRADAPQDACIVGARGWARLPHRFSQPDELVVCVDGKQERHVFPRAGYGYCHEAREVTRCLRAGEMESPAAPVDHTRDVMRVLDAVRAQWGLRYPDEARPGKAARNPATGER